MTALNVQAASVQSKKPGNAYGQVAAAPLSTTAQLLVRVGLPADIADGAVVTKADLVFAARGAWSGTRTVSAQRQTSWQPISQAKWSNRPAVAGTLQSTTIGALAAQAEIRIEVRLDVQAFFDGTLSNYGWRVSSDAVSSVDVFGPTASQLQPYLDLVYIEPGEVPFGLSPDGAAVSTDKPTLTFLSAADFTAIQVQVDPAANATSPAFDTGEVATTGRSFALSTSSYAGLALGASTSYRIRVKTSFGWSAYSPWATFSRAAKPTVTVTSPGSTSGDVTPPITWTAPGQAVWQADLLDGTGAVVASSGMVASSDLSWTPTKGLKGIGSAGTARVRVWDALERVATPGSPTYSEASQAFTVVTSSVAVGVTSLSSEQRLLRPDVELWWASSTPDEFQVARNGEWLPAGRIPGSARAFTDHTAPMNHDLTYQVLKVSNGAVSPNGPSRTVRALCTAIWLTDPETASSVPILGDDSGTVEMLEQAVQHAILGAPPVRRRAANLPPSGQVSGGIFDWPDAEAYADDVYAALMVFKDADPAHVYRLVLGDWNIPVRIGDVEAVPTPESGPDERIFQAGFSWWQTGSSLPWAT